MTRRFCFIFIGFVGYTYLVYVFVSIVIMPNMKTRESAFVRRSSSQRKNNRSAMVTGEILRKPLSHFAWLRKTSGLDKASKMKRITKPPIIRD